MLVNLARSGADGGGGGARAAPAAALARTPPAGWRGQAAKALSDLVALAAASFAADVVAPGGAVVLRAERERIRSGGDMADLLRGAASKEGGLCAAVLLWCPWC